MDPTAQQTPQPAQGSRLTLAIRLALVVVFVGLLAGVAYVLSVNKNPQTTKQKIAAQKNATVISPLPTKTPEIKEAEKKNAENLKKYGVVCKRFTSLDEAIKTSDIACILDLSEKGLSSLPNDITKLTNLNTIDLSNNNFSEFPSQLLKIPTLISIDFKNNKLTITPDVSKLTNLQSLILTGNPINDKSAPTAIPVPSQVSSGTKTPQPTPMLKITY